MNALDQVLREEVVARLDHQHLNHAVPEFAECRKIPSTENLAALIWTWVAPKIPEPARLMRLRLREDVDLWVDCYGPAAEHPQIGEWRGRAWSV